MGILLLGTVQLFITMNRILADLREGRSYYHQILNLEDILGQVWMRADWSSMESLSSGAYRIKGEKNFYSWEFSLRPSTKIEPSDHLNLVLDQSFPGNKSKVTVVLDHLKSGPRTMILMDSWKIQFQGEGQGGQYITLFQYMRPAFLDNVGLTRLS